MSFKITNNNVEAGMPVIYGSSDPHIQLGDKKIFFTGYLRSTFITLPERVMNVRLYQAHHSLDGVLDPERDRNQTLIQIESDLRWETTSSRVDSFYRPMCRTHTQFLCAKRKHHALMTICRGDIVTGFDDKYKMETHGTGYLRRYGRVHVSMPVKQVCFDDLSLDGVRRSWNNPTASDFVREVRITTAPNQPVLTLSCSMSDSAIAQVAERLYGKPQGGKAHHELEQVSCAWRGGTIAP